MAEIEETEWSGEELLDLEELTLSPEVMLLDPNNPRLLEAPLGSGDSRIPDEIANDPETQEQLVAQLRRDEEVQSLVTRIKSMGFVSSFERIVVRPALGVDGKYIVLEGNRRVAAVQTIKSNRAQYLNLSDKVRRSIDAIQVVSVRRGRPRRRLADSRVPKRRRRYQRVEAVSEGTIHRRSSD